MKNIEESVNSIASKLDIIIKNQERSLCDENYNISDSTYVNENIVGIDFNFPISSAWNNSYMPSNNQDVLKNEILD